MAHRRALKLFIAFSVCYKRQYYNPRMEHVLAFVQYLTMCMRSPGSVRNILSSLSTSYKRLSWDPAPFSGHHVMAALKSIEVNSRHEPEQKEGIAPEQLDVLISILLASTKDYSLACLISFGFTGFFRQSNMVPRSPAQFDRRRHFSRDDVRPAQGGLTVKVKWTKTLQRYKDATEIFLPEIRGRAMCPLTAFRIMLIRVPTTRADQPLFCYPDGDQLTLP